MQGGGTGRLSGRDVKRISPCMYISLISPVPFIWKEFCRDVFRPAPANWDPSSHNRDPG